MIRKVKEGAPRPEFGQPIRKKGIQRSFFQEGEDLPLFSGTPQQAKDSPFTLKEIYRQPELPGMPRVDYEMILKRDKLRRRKRR